MKKLLLIMTAMAFFAQSQYGIAQWTTSGSSAVTASGISNVYALNKLAVGVSSSATLTDYLTVMNNISLVPQTPTSLSEIRGRNSLNGLYLYVNTASSDGSYISMNGNSASTNPGLISFNAYAPTTPSGNMIDFNIVGTGFGSMTALAIDGIGNISINPTFATGSKAIYANCSSAPSFFGLYANSSPSNGSSIRLSGVGSGNVSLTSYQDASVVPPIDRFDFNIVNDGSPTMTALAIDQNAYLSINPTNPMSYRKIYGNAGMPHGIFDICGITSNTDGGYLRFSNDGRTELTANVSGITSLYPPVISFNLFTGSTTLTSLGITYNGKVIIGDDLIHPSINLGAHPDAYNLYVSKGIMTEMVKVAISTTSDWSDFVFNKNFKLMPLQQLENYIECNNHLPGIPSANDVVQNGVDLGDMDAKLLQKIEELTLYILQQQKQIEEQNQKIEKLENKLK